MKATSEFRNTNVFSLDSVTIEHLVTIASHYGRSLVTISKEKRATNIYIVRLVVAGRLWDEQIQVIGNGIERLDEQTIHEWAA